MSKELRGSLLFADNHPEVVGYIRINGQDYSVTGFWASKMRVNLEGDLIEGSDHGETETEGQPA